MAIVHLGAKRVQGLKIDRVNDSLGSSADGANTGITQTEGKLGGSPPNILVKDAQATTNTSSSGTTITNSSFTVANNSNRILIVCAYRFGSGGDISGITWNSSESFTRATFRDGSTETGRTEIWYLVNPTATTSNIVTTWDASTSRRGAGVYSFYNAKQTSPIGATAYDDEITTVTDGAITPTVSGSMIIDCIGSGSNGAPTDSLTAGWTSLIGGDDRSFSSQYKVDPTISSANTMAWTFASDKGVNWIAVEVKSANPSGSSTGTGAYSFPSQSVKPSVIVNNNSVMSGATSEFTFGGWVYRTFGNNSTNYTMFDTHHTAGNQMQMLRNTSNVWKLNFGTGSDLSLSGADLIPQNEWTHFCITRNSSSLYTVYINGVSKGTVTNSNSLNNGNALTFGLGKQTDYDGEYWEGKMDDWGLWSRVLTTTEIEKLVNDNATKLSLTEENGTSYVRTGAGTIYGEQILSGSPLIGQKINNIVMKVSKSSGTNSGNIKVGIWDTSSGATAKHTFWTGAGSGFVQEANPTNEVTFGLNGTTSIGGTHTTTESGVIAINDVIGIQATGSDIDYVYYRKTSATGDGTSKLVEYQGSWSSSDNGTMWLICNNGTPSAQLVSSLSDKSNLKAHYTMDSTSLGATELFEVTGSSGTGWTSSGTSINFNSAHSNAIGSTSTSSGDYVTRTISDLTGGATTTLDDEKWVVDFEAYHTGSSNNFNLEFATGTPSYSGSYYALGNFFQDNATTYYWITTDNNNGSRSESYFPSSPSGRLNDYKGEILYGRMTRLSSTSFKVEAFTDSGRTNSLGSATRTVNASIAGLDRMNVWANGGGGNYYVKNVKVYNGVTSLDGCKNDFSATSALDGQTNLPVNTIFEQTDDTPTYYWKQSDNTWKLDGNTLYESNFANNSTGWVLTSNFSLDTTNSRLNYSSAGTSDMAHIDIGSTGTGDWCLDFTQNASSAAGRFDVGMATAATAGSRPNKYDWQVTSVYNDWQIFIPDCQACDTNAYGSISPTTEWFVRMSHSVSNGTTIKAYTSAANRTNNVSPTGLTSVHSSEGDSVPNLKYIVVTITTGTGSGYVKDFKFWKGSSTPIE